MNPDKRIEWGVRRKIEPGGNLTMQAGEVTYNLDWNAGNLLGINKKRDDKSEEKFAAVSGTDMEFFVQPFFFDLPVLVKLKEELIVAPEALADFLVEVPVKTSLRGERGGHTVTLDEIKPAKVLQAFYGPADQGVFCIAFYSGIYTSLEEFQPSEFNAVLPVRLNNRSEEQIKITRIMIQTERLTLYTLGDLLVCSKVRIRITNSKEAFVDYEPQTPFPGASCIHEARIVRKERSLVSLSALRGGELQFGF